MIISCNSNKSSEQSTTHQPVNEPEPETSEEPEMVDQQKEEASKLMNDNVETNMDTLLGRWLRPDGNYVIQIDAINDDGKLEAQYFNPRPINIARAEIIPDESFRIFIEFDDRGYEGSSYDLIYDPAGDVLTGKYFQATYGQTYQIGFIRLQE
jgi:hypothetical protein